jgi:hypothetical protein
MEEGRRDYVGALLEHVHRGTGKDVRLNGERERERETERETERERQREKKREAANQATRTVPF